MQSDHSNQQLLIVDDDNILQVYIQKYLSNHGYDVICLNEGESICNVLEKKGLI